MGDGAMGSPYERSFTSSYRRNEQQKESNLDRSNDHSRQNNRSHQSADPDRSRRMNGSSVEPEVEAQQLPQLSAMDLQIKQIVLFLMVVLICESIISIKSLSYFKEGEQTLEDQIKENKWWMQEFDDYSNIQVSTSQTFQNDARFFLQRYSEFNIMWYQSWKSQFPLKVTQVRENLTLIVILVNLVKIALALLFALGERKAGLTLVFLFYPLRLMFFYNPFSIYNQPKQAQFNPEQPHSMKDEHLHDFNNNTPLRLCLQGI